MSGAKRSWRALGAVVAMALAAAASPVRQSGSEWPGYGGAGENHYSPLTQIDARNVARLGLAWSYDIDTGGSSLTAPVEAGGVVYFAASQSIVHAVDARTGRLLWKYDPEAGAAAGEKMRAAWGSRGIAYANGRVFVGTIDGRLIALSAKTGKPLWSAMTIGKDDGRYITGAPWVFRGKVVIGHGGADFAPVRGYVTAYDQATGKQAWRFYTVPGDPAKGPDGAASDSVMAAAAKTWNGQWWKYGGGGTAWNAFAYDPRYNRLYIGTGNGAPWNQKIRSPGGGDNWFVCSIIAVDADTGRYVWHYQINPGETWDFNAAMDIELADLTIDARVRHVLMSAPKNGFFYLIDRDTGKLISAKGIVPMNWARGIDANGRPIENPEARFPDGKAAVVYPSPFGAHNIEAMSFNPATGLSYIPIMDRGAVYVDPPEGVANWVPLKGQVISNGIGPAPAGVAPRKPTSALIAWNPLTQSEAWRIPLESSRGSGGTMATAGGLVFAGRASGGFYALDGASGRDLWRFDAQTAVMAQPISYAIAGRQYVTVIAGSRFSTAVGLSHEWDYRAQQWRVLTFALDGKASLPPANTEVAPIADDPGFVVNPALADAGAQTYARQCALCHGAAGMSGGAAPNLLRSPIPLDAAAFGGIVHDGLLVSRGMPRFAELNDAQREQLRHYIRRRAREVASGGKS